MRIVLGVMGGGNFHPGELLARGAILIHMAHGAHRVAVDGSDGVGRFPRSFRLVRVARTRRGTGRHAIAARPARERDQRHVAFAQCDRFSRVCGQRDVGGAADLSRIHVAKLQIHILRHRGGSGPRRIAGAEIAVNVLTRQPGVGQGTECHFGVELRDGLIRRQPRRMLENTGDIGLALNGHPGSFPLLRNISVKRKLQHCGRQSLATRRSVVALGTRSKITNAACESELRPPAPETAPTPSTRSRTKGRVTCHMTELGDAAGCHVCKWPFSDLARCPTYLEMRRRAATGSFN